MAKYFIYRNGQQEGPFEPQAVIGMKLSPETFVWCEGMTDWKPISQIPELQQPQPAAPPQFQQQVPPQTPPQAGPQGAPQFQQAYQQPQGGYQQQYQQQYQQPQYQQAYQQPVNYAPSGKSKVTAGILALLLGGLGIHYFYLGKATAGIVFLILSCTFIPSLLAFVQGIMMLTMSDEQFDQKYVNTESSFPLF